MQKHATTTDQTASAHEPTNNPTGTPGARQATPSAVVEHRCPATTTAGTPCRMRPTQSGWCLSHDPGRAGERTEQRRRGGTLTQARKALAKAKQDTIAKLGLVAELPALSDIESCQKYLVGVAARVESRQLSPAAGNTITNIVRLSKDLIALSLDAKLAAMLEEQEGRR